MAYWGPQLLCTVLVLLCMLSPSVDSYCRGAQCRRSFTSTYATNNGAKSTTSLIQTTSKDSPIPLNAFTAETDYLGLINFCLRSTDVALSGPSRSKVLNELTNDVFKALIIGNDNGAQSTLQSFSSVRETLQSVPCYMDMGENQLEARRPVTLLESGEGVARQLDSGADSSCDLDNGLRDLKTALEYTEWLEKLLVTGETTDIVLGGIYDKGYRGLLTLLTGAGCRIMPGQRPSPIESNICLSLIDLSTPIATKTKELNAISNCVSRAVLYGGKREKDFLAQTITNQTSAFASKWCNSDESAQEILFLKALSMLLLRGLAATEKLISSFEMTKSSSILGESRLEGGIGSISLSPPPLRLFDTYTNAFQRVVEVCLSEISQRADKVPQNEDVLLNFVQWEQSLRRNLTSEFWRENPVELAGTWELIDIAGQGSLQPIMVKDTDLYFGMTEGMMVELCRDGKVEMKFPGVEGMKWFFKPGPAHLDTCEFLIRSTTDSDLVLNYVGFIDRGQRIESRCVAGVRWMGGLVYTDSFMHTFIHSFT